MTQLELVRQYFPRANDLDADFILWEMTAYPVCGLDYTRRQLSELRDRVRCTARKGWRRKLAIEKRRQDEQLTRELAEIAKERQAREATSAGT
jgi:hypothetical protein